MSLEFTNDQQNELDRNARRAEAQSLAPIMRKNLPDDTPRLTDTQLEQQIAAALDRAAQLDVKTRSASVDFVILWLMLGPQFDERHEIQVFFKTSTASMDAKIKALMSEFKWRLRLGEDR